MSRLTLVIASLVSILATPLRADDVDFVRDIRPIISENCVFCHGPDAAQRQADLRLDVEDEAAAVIEKTDADASELFRRITTDDADELMPPADSNRQLTKEQIELIRRWINDGAKWEQHWSFRSLVKPEVPRVQQTNEVPVRNEIDRFVQSKLSEQSIRPAPEADRATLIRRLTLDLTGLPPTPAEVDAFLADEDPFNYESLVRRLLNSPAYGRRMAWDWLDAARYADSNGYQGDRERTMWPWRDWVVDAFNDNMPYDQFTLWQLAGDLLPDATVEQKLATGFCRNHMINGEGGRIAEENRVEYVMDMSETMGTVWLGMTLNCCRCHDHKFDPITNKEYYQLFAFFNQTPVSGGGGDPQTAPNLATPSKEQQARLDSLAAELKSHDDALAGLSKKLAKQQSEWERDERVRLQSTTQWHSLKPHTAFAEGQRLRVRKDNSVIAAGANPANDTYTLTAKTKLKKVTGVRLEALRDPTMTGGGLARSDSGNFVLTSFEVSRVTPESDSRQQQRESLKIASAEATFEQGSLTISAALDGNPKTGWAVHEGRIVDREHAAVFRFEKPVQVADDTEFEFVLRHDSVHKNHNLGRFRLSLTDSAQPKLSDAADQLLSDLNTASDRRTGEQNLRIAKAHRESDADYKKQKQLRDQVAKQRDDLQKSLPKVMVMADQQELRQTFVLQRGLYNKPTDEVQAALPVFLPAGEPETRANRLTLARWLVDADNPLTARVTVNRFWQQVFGVGLVKTTEDFGAQGEIPLHMDLLNWLAADFRDSGWDVKRLMNLMVTSHTYRQSSKIRDTEAYQRDPDNRLLARGSRYRMPSWMIRDQALAVSGLLSAIDRGPAVNTYQPPGVWEDATFGKKTYQQDSGEKLYRRSLYTFWRRIIAPTMFFDNASRQTCTVKSGRTNTPLHALLTLNDIAYVEAARNLAELALTADVNASDKHQTDIGRVQFIIRRVLARSAGDAELEIFLGGLARTRQQFAADPGEARKLISVGESKSDPSLDPAEHASWTALCLAVLNLDETLTRE